MTKLSPNKGCFSSSSSPSFSPNISKYICEAGSKRTSFQWLKPATRYLILWLNRCDVDMAILDSMQWFHWLSRQQGWEPDNRRCWPLDMPHLYYSEANPISSQSLSEAGLLYISASRRRSDSIVGRAPPLPWSGCESVSTWHCRRKTDGGFCGFLLRSDASVARAIETHTHLGFGPERLSLSGRTSFGNHIEHPVRDSPYRMHDLPGFDFLPTLYWFFLLGLFKLRSWRIAQ